MLRSFYIFLFCACIISFKSNAQYVNIRQWQANYFYTNPAFTGIAVSPKITADYTQIFPAIFSNIRRYEVNYDQRISEKAGSIGASLLYADPNALETRSVAGINYAYTFNLKDELKLRTATSLSYVFSRIDTSKIISADKEKFATSRSAAYLGLGALLTYKNTFLGISAFSFTAPLISKNAAGKNVFVEDVSAQAGGFFPINKSNPKSTVIAPSVLVYGYLKNISIAPGININKGIFTGGLCYRAHSYNNDLAITAGISKGWIKAGYTYDLGIPDARSVWAASHELTLTIYPTKVTDTNKDLAYYFRKMGF